MSLELILGLIGGLGIGSVITAFVRHYLDQQSANKDRLYSEKRNAYINLLTCLHDAAVKPSDATSKAYALEQTKISIFGSSNVSIAVQGIIDTNDGPPEKRKMYFDMLIDEMKKDLGVE